MRGLKGWAVAVACASVLASSGCGERDLSNPPKIRYGSDACVECRMIIGDERFACAAVSGEGRFLKFDDIGCLAAHKKSAGKDDLRSWVSDADGRGWIRTEEAYFVYSEMLVTPMGYGLSAFVDEPSARRFAQEKEGRLVSWEEIAGIHQNKTDFKRGEEK